MRAIKNAFILISWILLTGCSVFSPIQSEPQSKYVLDALPHVQKESAYSMTTLLVAEPQSDTVFDTKQIAYSVRPHEVAYYTRNEWAEAPTEMIHSLIIQSLQNTHAFHAIVQPPFAGVYQFQLNTQIQNLRMDFTKSQPLFYLTIRAQLINTTDNHVVATRVFSEAVPIQDKTPYGGVVAANTALAKILEQLTQFCLRSAQ